MIDVPQPGADADDLLEGLSGRTEDLRALVDLWSDVRSGRGRSMVLLAEPGMGKTTLLQRAARAAAGGRAVRVAGSPAERDLAWAGLYELCRPLLDHRSDLARVQQSALLDALGLRSTNDGPPDVLAVGHATLQLLAATAEEEPLLVVVDDADWLDVESRSVLGFVARRLEAERVGLLMASRAPLPMELLHIPTRDLEPLTRSDALSLLARTAGVVRTDVAEQLIDTAAGNPLAIHELARTASPGQLRGEESLPAVLPAGAAPELALGSVLDRLPTRTVTALLVLAAARTEDLVHVRAVMESLGLELEDLEHAEPDLVSLSSGKVRFVHPLARTAVYERARPGERRRVHAAHAAALGEGPVDRRAWHLAAATVEQDPAVAELLAGVARESSRRGACAAASRAWEEAARLAAEPAMRSEYLREAAACAVVAEAADRARDLAAEAERVTGDAVQQARAVQLQLRADRLSGLTGRTVDRAVRTAEAVEDADPLLAVSLYLDAVTAAVASARPAAALPAALAADRLCGEHPVCREALGAEVVVGVGIGHVAAGQTKVGLELLSTVPALGADGADPFTTDRLMIATGSMLTWAEEYDLARRTLAQCFEAGRRRPRLLPEALLTSSTLEFRTGRWVAAADAAERALELCRAVGQDTLEAPALLAVAIVRACQGRPEAASLVDEALDVVGERSMSRVRRHAAVVRANLALATGRPAAAVVELETLASGPGPNPAAEMSMRDLIEAHVLCGHGDVAIPLLDRFEQQARAAASRRPLAAAARVRGMLAGTAPEADDHFRRALDLAGDSLPFTLALTHLRWASRLSEEDRRDDACRQAHLAWEIFEQLDAPGWLDQAGSVIEAAGGRPPEARTASETSGERVLLEALSEGTTVQAVADSLLLSTQTAEERVRAVLEKRGAHSVPELIGVRADLGAESGHRFHLLGRFEVLCHGEDVTPPTGILTTTVQLVALRGVIHVDELTEELWPDAEPGRGRTRLRNVLARIRRSSGDLLVRQGETIALVAGASMDVGYFEEAADRALDGDQNAISEALQTYGGDLLPDQLYAAWTVAPRERLRRKWLAVLDLAAGHAQDEGRAEDARRLLETAIDAEPYDESRYIRVMRLLGQDRRGAALEVGARARRRLAELDLDPSPALLAAERELRAGPAR